MAESDMTPIESHRYDCAISLRGMAEILGITTTQLGEVESGKATLTTVRGMVAPKLGVRRFFERITWSEDDHVWWVRVNNGWLRLQNVLYQPWPSTEPLGYNCTKADMLTAARTELEEMK